MLGPALGLGLGCCAHLELKLYRAPKRLVDDPQFRNVLHRPVIGSVRANPHTSGYRLDDLACPVVDKLADIKSISQHAVAAPPPTKDCTPLPQTAPRPRHALAIKALGDLPRRLTSGIFPEDASHDLGLVRLDLAKTTHEQATFVDAVRRAVAVGEAGWGAP